MQKSRKIKEEALQLKNEFFNPTDNSPYHMQKNEIETHIMFDRSSDRAIVETWDPVYIRKLDKLCAESPENYTLGEKLEWRGNTYATYSMPVSFLSFKSKRGQRNLTEEQRKVLAERMRELRISTSSKDI